MIAAGLVVYELDSSAVPWSHYRIIRHLIVEERFWQIEGKGE